MGRSARSNGNKKSELLFDWMHATTVGLCYLSVIKLSQLSHSVQDSSNSIHASNSL
jgi:hypothetical protein